VLTKLTLSCVMIAFAVGCGSPESSNVASEASQEQIDQYNRLIQEEAERAAKQVDKDDI
jgi:hypothetical protein